jgi:AcrR family transcriptional regulator
MDDVAADAGVAKTTVYRRWPTKPALVAEAVRTLYLDRIDPVDTGDLRSDLVALGCGFHELLYEGPGRVLEDLVRESGMTRELAGVVATTTDARRRAYRAVLDRAVERGELDPGVPHELVIDMLVGPLWTRLLITDTPMTASDVEAAVGAVLDGIRRPPSLGT